MKTITQFLKSRELQSGTINSKISDFIFIEIRHKNAQAPRDGYASMFDPYSQEL